MAGLLTALKVVMPILTFATLVAAVTGGSSPLSLAASAVILFGGWFLLVRVQIRASRRRQQ